MTEFQTFLLMAACFATAWLLLRGVVLAVSELAAEVLEFLDEQTNEVKQGTSSKS